MSRSRLRPRCSEHWWSQYLAGQQDLTSRCADCSGGSLPSAGCSRRNQTRSALCRVGCMGWNQPTGADCRDPDQREPAQRRADYNEWDYPAAGCSGEVRPSPGPLRAVSPCWRRPGWRGPASSAHRRRRQRRPPCPAGCHGGSLGHSSAHCWGTRRRAELVANRTGLVETPADGSGPTAAPPASTGEHTADHQNSPRLIFSYDKAHISMPSANKLLGWHPVLK